MIESSEALRTGIKTSIPSSRELCLKFRERLMLYRTFGSAATEFIVRIVLSTAASMSPLELPATAFRCSTVKSLFLTICASLLPDVGNPAGFFLLKAWIFRIRE